MDFTVRYQKITFYSLVYGIRHIGRFFYLTDDGLNQQNRLTFSHTLETFDLILNTQMQPIVDSILICGQTISK
jgi:hypothetical protein